MIDFSDQNMAATVVLLKAMYKAAGQDPVGVQLCVSEADQDYVWRREARKYLVEQAKRRQQGRRGVTLKELINLQDVPSEWDELAGDRPGEAEQRVTH